MRIIAGAAGGITIRVPQAVTRPTMDRTRQALFSMLGDIVVGARVLDLFAGSGALGLEALSRGAAHAVFVEHHRAAAQVIRENLARTRLQGGEVRQGDVFRTLRLLSEQGARFDLVLADPPYHTEKRDTDLGRKLIDSPDLWALLEPGGHFILECRVTKDGNDSWSGWKVEKDREYGSTRILWLRKGDVENTQSGSV